MYNVDKWRGITNDDRRRVKRKVSVYLPSFSIFLGRKEGVNSFLLALGSLRWVLSVNSVKSVV